MIPLNIVRIENSTQGVRSSTLLQRREIHTCNCRASVASRPGIHLNQRRNILLTGFRSSNILKDHNIPVVEEKKSLNKDQLCLAVTFDRPQKTPCIRIAPFADGYPVWNDSRTFPFVYGETPMGNVLETWVVSATSTARAENQVDIKSNLAAILIKLIETFYQENASSLFVRVAKSSDEEYVVVNHRCELDDAALRLNKAPGELQFLREEQKLSPEEIEAARDGIVYWR